MVLLLMVSPLPASVETTETGARIGMSATGDAVLQSDTGRAVLVAGEDVVAQLQDSQKTMDKLLPIEQLTSLIQSQEKLLASLRAKVAQDLADANTLEDLLARFRQQNERLLAAGVVRTYIGDIEFDGPPSKDDDGLGTWRLRLNGVSVLDGSIRLTGAGDASSLFESPWAEVRGWLETLTNVTGTIVINDLGTIDEVSTIFTGLERVGRRFTIEKCTMERDAINRRWTCP